MSDALREHHLPIGEILGTVALEPEDRGGETIGTSREDRPLVGYRYGRGRLHVSLLGGCHADEPVGPAMLDRLASTLCCVDDDHPLLERYSWWIVPHVNPDGEARNAAWTETVDLALPDALDEGYLLDLYLRHVVRELPGDDVEFGFPRSPADAEARPENQVVAEFLRPGAPLALHASFHGMAFGAGPWFLIEESWADRTTALRDRLRRRVGNLGYHLHDPDRGGEKGFTRIDEGFTTRPDSEAMRRHFENAGDPEMAARFRPSSMEHVRSLGGDPFTFVSEMPLFLLPTRHWTEGDPVRPPAVERLRAANGEAELAETSAELGLRPMPLGDQMRLQLAFLDEALEAVIP